MPALTERQRRFTCTDCGVGIVREGRRCYPCYLLHRYPTKRTREYKIAYMKVWHKQAKDDVFNAYGGYRCTCCGETEEVFLVIDHINGGGNKERRKIRTRGGAGQYCELRKKGFPLGYQVLCHNCNYAKTRGGCPHVTSKN